VTNLTEIATGARLKKVGTRPKLGVYLRDFFQRRTFAIAFAEYSLQAQTARSSLGVAWHVLVPALQIGVYGVIFGVLLSSIRPPHFVPYLMVGIVLFQFITGSFSEGARSITNNGALVRSLEFPRILLPASVVISNIMRVVPLLALMLIGVAAFGELPKLSWLWLIPDFVMMVLFAAGATMIAARLTVHTEDVNQLLPFVVRILFYVSGVFWNIDKMIHIHWLKGILHNNPIHLYMAIARAGLIDGYTVTVSDWLVAAAWSVGILAFGTVFFWLAEEKYGRNV
jgi:teichoic acid transport system permease protein